MRWLTCAVILSLFSALLAPSAYGQTYAPTVSFEVDAPRFPTPLQTSAGVHGSPSSQAPEFGT